MCGIVGAIGNIDGNIEKAVKEMLIFDTVRGEHSTGLLSVRKYDEEEYILAKQVGNPFELFDTPAFKRIMGGSSRILLGHNRYATQGKVNKFNAHPFDFDSLVGVHNGSLNNKHALHEGTQWDVDSQALYAHIEAKGVEDALRTARGAFALVWWDKKNNTMNFIRNDERPLYYSVTTKMAQPVMLFASEPWMIEVACLRQRIEICQPENLPVGVLHTVPVGKGGVLGKPLTRQLEFAPPIQTYVYGRPVVVSANAKSEGNTGNVAASANTTQTSTGASNVKSIASKQSIMDPLFAAQKSVLFEALCLNKDAKTGADYIVCYAPSHPYLECRLYRHTAGDRIFNAIGCEFEGDISSFVMTEGIRGYYKVSPHSVKITSFSSSTEEDATEDMYPNHKGEDIDLGSWLRKYSSCVFCTGNVVPEDLEEGARFTREGEILCKDCANDKELTSYVELI